MKHGDFYFIEPDIKGLFYDDIARGFIAIIDGKLKKYCPLIKFVAFNNLNDVESIEDVNDCYTTIFDYNIEKYINNMGYTKRTYYKFSDNTATCNRFLFFVTDDIKTYTTLKFII